MSPQGKLFSIALFIATGLMFEVILIINFLTVIVNINPLFSIISTSIISLGVYRLVVDILVCIVNRIIFLKKIVFGPSYMGGVWVGF